MVFKTYQLFFNPEADLIMVLDIVYVIFVCVLLMIHVHGLTNLHLFYSFVQVNIGFPLDMNIKKLNYDISTVKILSL